MSGSKRALDHAATASHAPKRPRRGGNGPFFTEVPPNGASAHCDDNQLVFASDRIWVKDGKPQFSKFFWTHSWDEAWEHFRSLPDGQRDYYEWVRSGTPVFAFGDIDRYSDKDQDKWTNADPRCRRSMARPSGRPDPKRYF